MFFNRVVRKAHKICIKTSLKNSWFSRLCYSRWSFGHSSNFNHSKNEW